MRIWKNASGQLDGIRKHLKDDHDLVWRDACIKMKLKGWELLDLPKTSPDGESRAYTRDEFTIPRIPRTVITFFLLYVTR